MLIINTIIIIFTKLRRNFYMKNNKKMLVIEKFSFEK